MNLGELILKAMRRSKHTNTYEGLALKANISHEHLRRIVKGMFFPSGETLERILSVLEVDVEVQEQAWALLVAHQLDAAVLRHVQVCPDTSKFIDAASWVAMEVATENYPTTSSDKRRKIRKEVKERLCKMVASDSAPSTR